MFKTVCTFEVRVNLIFINLYFHRTVERNIMANKLLKWSICEGSNRKKCMR